MLNYKEFINESVIYDLINETHLYLVDDIREVLNDMNSDIAKDILSLQSKKIEKDITFVSLSDNLGYLDFSTEKNILKNIENFIKDDDDLDSELKPVAIKTVVGNIQYGLLGNISINYITNEYPDILKKSRSSLKLGKFINKLFPNKYNSQQIEEFTNKFKARIEKTDEEFKLVSGDEIKKWYLEDNYYNTDGNLGNSCMKYKRCQDYFDIYTKNPDVCQMLILLREGKLIGRAIVWKLSNYIEYHKEYEVSDLYFMDRQYTIDQHDVDKFKNYAKEKGWAYKTYNNHHSLKNVTYNGQDKMWLMEVRVDDIDYDKYPYMDTFKSYSHDDGILYNREGMDDVYTLTSTDGSYQENDEYYSEWHGRYLEEDEAIWSEIVQSYIDSYCAVRINLGGVDDYVPDDYDGYAYIENHDGYALTRDCVWSDYTDEYILKEDAVTVWNEVLEDGRLHYDDYTHEDNSDIVATGELVYHKGNMYTIDSLDWFLYLKTHIWDDYPDYLNRENLVLNYDGYLIPDALSLTVYKVSKPTSVDPVPLKGVEWLSEVDSIILGYSIISSQSRVIDKVEYTQSIKHLISKLVLRAGQAIEAYSDSDIGKGQQTMFDVRKSRSIDGGQISDRLRQRRYDLTNNVKGETYKFAK